MHTSRKGLLEQTNTKQKNTAKRKEVSQKIDGFYNSSKVKVENILSSLETEVAQRFAKGAEIARKAFEGHIAEEMAAYKKERYGDSWISWKQLRRVKDWAVGLPDKVNEFFTSGRKVYIDAMDQCIDGIANLVAQRLKEAKQAIAEGKRNIKEYVGSLDPDLQKIGKQAAEDIQSKFDELDNSVNATKNDLIDTLADQYAENLATVDARILTLKEKNKGFVAKAKESMGGVIKQILAFKTKLMALLGDVSDVITQIITSPISFFKNLAKGVGKGFQNFGGNIMKHMKTGLIGWLTGAMSSMNIQMPEDVFSLKGIFSLSTQILGFTWDRIRNVGVKVVGEPMVGALEKGGSMIMTLREKGVSGAWKDIKEQFTDLKETVMDSIKDMVITQVIQAGIKWMLSLLSPAGAFVKAVMAIISVVKFFMERASQIADLVKAFMDSIAAIAKGKVAAVAESIENALVKSIPVLIGLLASVLGIGGLAKKVSNIMRKIQTRIETAIKGIWLKLKKTGRKLFRKLGIGKKGKKKKDKDKKTGDSEVGKVVHFKEKDGESHKLWFKDSPKGAPVLMVASTPATLEDRIKNWKTRIEDVEDEEDKEIVEPALKLVIAKEKELGNDALTVDQLMEKAKKTDDTKDDIKAEKIDDKLENEQQKLSTSIAILFDYLGDVDSKVKNHTGKLLSQDALVKSGDKKLTLKTSTKDLSFVGHRAKETVSNKTGIIVSSKEGNNYTKAIDDGKKSVEDEYKKLNKITNIEERRKAIGHVPEHKEYEPVLLFTKIDDPKPGKMTLVYTYKNSNQKFEVTYDFKTGLPESTQSINLELNDLGRGELNEPIKKGLDRAHIVADELSGTGYKVGKNIIYTSMEYNRETMRAEERKIGLFLKENYGRKLDSFDLNINIHWGKDINDVTYSDINKAIKTRLNDISDYGGTVFENERETLKNLPKEKDKLMALIDKNIKDIGQPRVMNVVYKLISARLKNGNTESINEKFEIDKPDYLFGTINPK